jgi:hypothetical protein
MRFTSGTDVRLVGIPAELPVDDLATRSVFERCLGQVFTIQGFNSVGMAELCVEKVTGSVGETIWVEETFLSDLEEGRSGAIKTG